MLGMLGMQGRTLLTDADGLYNAFLVAAASATNGNVFVALTNFGDPPSAEASKQYAPSRTCILSVHLHVCASARHQFIDHFA